MRWNNGSSRSQEGGRQSLLKRSVVIDRGRESARGGEGGGAEATTAITLPGGRE